MRAAGEQRLTSVRSASERVSETVIAAVLLLHERLFGLDPVPDKPEPLKLFSQMLRRNRRHAGDDHRLVGRIVLHPWDDV